MCGRLTLIDPEFGIKLFLPLNYDVELPPWKPRYNLAPTQPIAALAQSGNRLKLRLFRWGAQGRYPMINLRSEELLSKKGLATSLRNQRCLIIGDGFYEWKKSGPTKVPYWIHPPTAGLMMFAGLWYRWRDETGSSYDWATLLTQAPTPQMREIHDRMPVILDRRDACRWLDPELKDQDQAITLVQNHQTPELSMRIVSSRVNRPANDDAGIFSEETQPSKDSEGGKGQTTLKTPRARKPQSTQ